MRCKGSANFIQMSDTSSLVSRVSDSMSRWYRNMGGMITEVNIAESEASWVSCRVKSQDTLHVSSSALGDPESPGCSVSVHDETEVRSTATESF